MEHQDISVPAVAGETQCATSAHSFLQTLADRGVSVAFGIPGGTASPLFDALRSVRGLRYVANRHEAGAAFAALGFARATGTPAVVLTTSGPGVTNTLTAVASAYAEEVPMILVCGEVPLRAYGRGALQDGTSVGWRAHDVIRPITQWCGCLATAGSAPAVASKALLASTVGTPGPVFVTVPLDIGSSVALATEIHLGPPRAPDEANESACRLLGHELSRASRPLMVLGNGARRAGAEAIHVAERLSIPVAVTAHAKGVFPERHPLYLGVLGLGQHPSVDEYLRSPPDVSLVVGSGLDDLATNGWSLPLVGTRVSFQIDRDARTLGRSMAFTHLIVGDAARALETTVGFLPSDVARPVRTQPRFSKLCPELAHSDAVPLKPPRALRALAEAFPNAVWVSDIGEHLAYALHYLQVDGPSDFHNFLGFGSMGSGIGAAVGIQLALPDRQVVCVCGDGGFAMMLGELLTCVEQQLPVVFAVMNDGRWNMVEHGFRTVYGAVPDGFVNAVADYAATAQAIGAVGAKVATPEDLDPPALRALVKARLPVVLDVRIDASESLTPGTRAASIRHFCAEVS
ncbi:MAG: thiamine pyrophosphate-binding protein [Myxococcales bacterium]|nr:thiamine pyrophosphate-binding protein [Myxococcales bacterium]